MKKYILFALKNVFRNKRRTLITLIVISFGTISLILAGGFVDYSFWGLRESTIRGQLGHLQIFNPKSIETEEEKPLEFGITDQEKIKKIIGENLNVRFSMSRIEFFGLISNGDKSIPFMGQGVEPEKEIKLSQGAFLQSEGKYLGEEIENKDEEIVLGKELAKSLKAKPGDWVTLLSSTTKGNLNALDVKVVGLISTGVPDIDKRIIQVNLPTAQKLIHTDKVSKIIVALDDTMNTDATFIALSTKLKDFTIKRWSDLAVFYNSVVSLYYSIFTFLGLIIVIIIILSGSNTMMMSIMERTKEIGTLLAIGTTRGRIFVNFLYEGLLIGAIGGGLGIVIGFILITVINHAGINMPPPPGSSNGYPLFVHHVPLMYIGSFILMSVISVISTVIPAIKAYRLKIVDALGHN